MNTTTEISIHDIEILTEMSDSSKSKVYLASVKGTTQFVVYKELEGKGNLQLYKKIRIMQEQEKVTCFPKIYGLWEENEKIFIIEEYISGGTLGEKIKKGIKFSEEELTDYMLQLCTVLRKLHNANPPIIHRDLKPDNIIITENGELKLLDFDAAREYNTALSHDTVLLGTKAYAPPEQYGFTQTDVRSDIYSFGKVFGELLNNANASEIYIQRCRKIIEKATMFDPDNRYVDSNALSKELLALKKAPFDKKKILMPFFAVCLVIVGITFGFIIGRSWQNDSTESDADVIINQSGTSTDHTTPEETTTAEPQTTTEEPTTTEPQTTTEPPTTPEPTIPDGAAQTIWRFALSYGEGITEYYELYDGVYNRICELNNSEYDYVITYLDNTGFETSHYVIQKLPPFAGSITFAKADTFNHEKDGFIIKNVSASYPIIANAHLCIHDCTFGDFTIDDISGDSWTSLYGENVFKNIILINDATLFQSYGHFTTDKLIMKDYTSRFGFTDKTSYCYIKELVGYNGQIRTHINKGHDTVERKLIITDSDISPQQVYTKAKLDTTFVFDVRQNEDGQNVIYFVPYP